MVGPEDYEDEDYEDEDEDYEDEDDDEDYEMDEISEAIRKRIARMGSRR